MIKVIEQGKPLPNICLLVDCSLEYIAQTCHEGCIKLSQVFCVPLSPAECEVLLSWNTCTTSCYFHNKCVESKTKLESKSNTSVSISEHEVSKLWLPWANSEWLLLMAKGKQWSIGGEVFNCWAEEMTWSLFFHTVKYLFKVKTLSRKMSIHSE